LVQLEKEKERADILEKQLADNGEKSKDLVSLIEKEKERANILEKKLKEKDKTEESSIEKKRKRKIKKIITTTTIVKKNGNDTVSEEKPIEEDSQVMAEIPEEKVIEYQELVKSKPKQAYVTENPEEKENPYEDLIPTAIEMIINQVKSNTENNKKQKEIEELSKQLEKEKERADLLEKKFKENQEKPTESSLEKKRKRKVKKVITTTTTIVKKNSNDLIIKEKPNKEELQVLSEVPEENRVGEDSTIYEVSKENPWKQLIPSLIELIVSQTKSKNDELNKEEKVQVNYYLNLSNDNKLFITDDDNAKRNYSSIKIKKTNSDNIKEDPKEVEKTLINVGKPEIIESSSRNLEIPDQNEVEKILESIEKPENYEKTLVDVENSEIIESSSRDLEIPKQNDFNKMIKSVEKPDCVESSPRDLEVVEPKLGEISKITDDDSMRYLEEITEDIYEITEELIPNEDNDDDSEYITRKINLSEPMEESYAIIMEDTIDCTNFDNSYIENDKKKHVTFDESPEFVNIIQEKKMPVNINEKKSNLAIVSKKSKTEEDDLITEEYFEIIEEVIPNDYEDDNEDEVSNLINNNSLEPVDPNDEDYVIYIEDVIEDLTLDDILNKM